VDRFAFFEPELETLQLTGGDPHVELSRHDVSRRSLLLERLGPPLVSLGWPPTRQLTTVASAPQQRRSNATDRQVLLTGVNVDLDFRAFCRRSKLPKSKRSRDLFAAERHRRGATDIPFYEAYNPFRQRQQGPCP